MNIQWFPGHMAKTRRLITENLKLVDIVIELLDARIPLASKNPMLPEILGNKPRVVVLNKSDMANDEITKKWISYYKSIGITAVATDSVTGKGYGEFKNAVNYALREKIAKDSAKGMKNVSPKMMIVGIPNVGKSSFINKLSKRAGTKTGDTPGVTKTKQWIRISGGYELLDTPGILWPKFDDEIIGLHLAYTGAIKDDVYDVSEVACKLCVYLRDTIKEDFEAKYKLSNTDSLEGHEILFELGKKRGCLISGGEVDYERASRILLDDFRGCKISKNLKITLESPEDINND